MQVDLFYSFVKAINDHDVESLYNLMSESHKFIDSHGNEIYGRESMKDGWAGYFKWFPNYNIDVIDVFEKDNTIAAFGFANASYLGNDNNYWRIPAAWKAKIENDKISLWQVYADTKIPFDSIKDNNT